MANICENTIYCSSKSATDIRMIKQFLDENFETYDSGYNDDYMDMKFSSKWEFPEKEMREMTSRLEDKENANIRVTSIEWGNGYIATHVFRNGEWR